MAFFDEKVSINIETQMVVMLKSIDKSSENSKCLEIKNIYDLYNLNIASFISSRSMQFFERFEINTDFSSLNLSERHRNDDFSKGSMLVRYLKVVNDVVEHVVKLVEDYNCIL
ncbi:hypothetical protein PV325_012779, partial [Microctonus aethiopoides]